jgi:ABC-type sugar transport system ATPase subunit
VSSRAHERCFSRPFTSYRTGGRTCSLSGVSIIVIDHSYAHLFELCGRINVMQGGRVTIDQPVQEMSLEELTKLMISSFRSQIEGVSSDGA